MKHLEVITTEDGSKTCLHPEHRASYRSIHGAVTEVRHVFIGTTLVPLLAELEGEGSRRRLSVLEFGFGLGTSFGETYLFARENNLFINYLSLEREPVPPHFAQHPNSDALAAISHLLAGLQAGGKESCYADPYIDARVLRTEFLDFDEPFFADAIFFDPFGPEENAASWRDEVFEIAAKHILPTGRLATYSVAGEVRRAMRRAGFTVEKVPGPPYKREISLARLNPSR